MKKDKIIYIIIIVLILGVVIYKKFIEVPGDVAGQIAIEDLISQVHYEDAEKHLKDIFIEKENNFNSISLPEFQNINEAPNSWVWNVLYNNLENEENEYSYEQIQEKLIELFSNKLEIKFPEEGIEGVLEKNKENDLYYKVELQNNNTNKYGYNIKTLSQEDNIYKIYIIEYELLCDEQNYILIDCDGNEINKFESEDEIENEISRNEYNLNKKEITIKIEETGKPNVVSIVKKN